MTHEALRHRPPTQPATDTRRTPPVVQRQREHGGTAMANFRYARSPAGGPAPDARRAPLPSRLRTGIEQLSGMAMDRVTVHYNSHKPGLVQAHAYAQGGDIHLGPGQERHLPHEAWHVLQQRQGRVKPTMAAHGVAINDDRALEQEADRMGSRAMNAMHAQPESLLLPAPAASGPAAMVAQRVVFNGVDYKDDPKHNNRTIISDALDAIIEAQNGTVLDPDSWISWVDAINVKLQASGPTKAVLAEISQFYQQVAELSFKVNPVLAEAWRRCRDATSDWNNYSQVGGKFKDKFTELLDEISTDFPALAAKAGSVTTFKVNKEHMVNKGVKFKGAQTDFDNLMYAAAPPTGSTATLSEFHKSLHAMKPGTGKVDYNALHPDIRKVIEDEQKKYNEHLMGKFV
ncbi:DUF4157 domain-containing protein [Janthinobacterium sp. FT14W]|uniref:eCIS core domain-containing protein n=1 Tax=Janthinobacterium sp. FT14W TaxID=2654253 RepID=UPI001264CC40|nr:DUF4157 domain-containing protein [Janthinobacterium sp. FT14W]KAB8051897.1 DUF4157 domain-containing protein [Janthinobacterium sp. FT14W]